MRLATAEEVSRWDELIAGNPDGGNALQGFSWGEFKSRWGWQPKRYIYELGDCVIAAQWLAREVAGCQSIWYCPKGPGVISVDDLKAVVAMTREAQPDAVFCRFEPEVLADDMPSGDLRGLGLVRANRDPGSKSTIVIDLSQGDDEVLASFNQSARRNIRRAQAAGVEVTRVPASDQNLDTMFDLMRETEARAHYGLRPKAYFCDYWRSLAEAGVGQIYFATHESDVLAGLFVTHLGQRAWYKDGGSRAIKREMAATYLIQWEVMRSLMSLGVTSYDMVGVPNRDQVGKGDSRDGLYEFKSKFNPNITEFIGCWDLPTSRLKYTTWRKVGERLAGRAAMRSAEKFLY